MNSNNQITITGVSNGLASITVTFKPTDNQNYNDSESKTYSVNGYKIASEGVCNSNLTYNGSLQPLATGGIGIELQNNSMKDANTYQVTEKLVDGYRWSDNTTLDKTLSCTINPKPVTNVTVNLGSTDFTYNGGQHQPTVTSVLDGSIPLTLTTDYKVSYSNNITAGTNTAKVIITGQNNYTGTKEVPFTIKQAEPTLSYEPVSGFSVQQGEKNTFKINAPIAGTFNVTSRASGTASVTFTPSTGTSTTVTVNGLAAGSTTFDVTFTPTDNVNYASKTETYNVKVTNPPAVTQLKDKLGQGGLVGIPTNCSEESCTPIIDKNADKSTIREYRYSGGTVNNYVTFNDELWRIIGIFKDESGQEHMKIVRKENLEESILPSTYETEEKTFQIKFETSAAVYWNLDTDYNENNNWADAGLMYWLNSKGTDSNDVGYLKKLSNNAQNMIAETKYYLGNVLANFQYYDRYDTPIQAYSHERGSITCNSSCYGGDIWPNYSATWTGKIALMYPSDLGFSMDSSYWNSVMHDWNSNQINSTWIGSAYTYEWLLSPSSMDKRSVTLCDSGGLEALVPSLDPIMGISPTLYLKSEVQITGEGTGEETNPYQLSCDTCTETSSPSTQDGPTIFDDNAGNNNSNTKNIATTGTCNNLVYNGETQDLVSGGSNTSYENNNQSEAGTYQVIAKANTGYTFSDGTTTKTLDCNINKKIIPVNFNTNTLKYNGTYQSPVASATGVKGETIELETTKEKELGEYTTIATMKEVNPNYSLSNTVLDYKITNTNETNKITNITKVKINYYLKNKDIDSYSLVKSIEQDAKVGETVTGELINFTNYKTPQAISIKIIKGVNVIDYYYLKSN